MSEYEISAKKIELGQAMIKKVYADFFAFNVASNLTDLDLDETDFSTLTVKEIMDKIRGFLAQNPKNVNQLVFLEYLAKYPVSMCKRDVSPLLKRLIGFHYKSGNPDEEQVENGAQKVSYDDLSEIFVRSKATISECVNKTESEWREIHSKMVEEAKLEAEAKRQILEEKKQKLREMEEKQSDSRTNERTPSSSSGRI